MQIEAAFLMHSGCSCIAQCECTGICLLWAHTAENTADIKRRWIYRKTTARDGAQTLDNTREQNLSIVNELLMLF